MLLFPHVDRLLNIALRFATLNTVLSLGLCLSYIRHWAGLGEEIKGGKEGETFIFLNVILIIHTDSTAWTEYRQHCSITYSPHQSFHDKTSSLSLSGSLFVWRKK